MDEAQRKANEAAQRQLLNFLRQHTPTQSWAAGVEADNSQPPNWNVQPQRFNSVRSLSEHQFGPTTQSMYEYGRRAEEAYDELGRLSDQAWGRAELRPLREDRIDAAGRVGDDRWLAHTESMRADRAAHRITDMSTAAYQEHEGPGASDSMLSDMRAAASSLRDEPPQNRWERVPSMVPGGDPDAWDARAISETLMAERFGWFRTGNAGAASLINSMRHEVASDPLRRSKN